MPPYRPLVTILLLLALVSCSNQPPPPATTVLTETPAPVNTVIPTDSLASTPEVPVSLRIWVPPQFDPGTGTPAAIIFQARLNEFATQHNLQIELRVKSIEGSGGLLDALSAASAAAPLALPDLVALPRPLLEAAAIKGLVRPLDGLTQALDSPDWYDYARQLAHLQNSTFGLPFAGDALVIVYRPSVVGTPPGDWGNSLKSKGPLAFPAADPQALVTLALYQAAGGRVQDGQGRPTIDPVVLSQVLTYYQQAAQAKWMPYWLTQFETDNQSWEAYRLNQSALVITWSSHFLAEMPSDGEVAVLPTPSGAAYTLATGWVWAIASPRQEQQILAAQLAEFLTSENYLAQWTYSAGFLPPRATALSAWPETAPRSLISQVSSSAHLISPAELLSSLGPPLQQAVIQVLKEQADPMAAAQSAATKLSNP